MENNEQLNEDIRVLRDFFEKHPTWVEAAKPVREGANSAVYFAGSSVKYHLYRSAGISELRPGPAPSPDFEFLFTSASIRALANLEGEAIADFAIELFERIQHQDPDEKIGFHVVGSIGQILRRGYLQVLLKGGPRVLQYAAAHGIKSLSDFSRLLRGLRGKDVDWTQFRESNHG